MGPVSGLSGSCPALTFSIGTKTVRTNTSTQFGSSGCAAIKNGVQVAAQGTEQKDGSLVASFVRVGMGPGR
jgi:hypothetical protein